MFISPYVTLKKLIILSHSMLSVDWCLWRRLWFVFVFVSSLDTLYVQVACKIRVYRSLNKDEIIISFML